MTDYGNSLIYGNDDTLQIVSIEVDGEDLIIFKEINGKIITERRDARYWLLTNKSIAPGKEYKLEGNQFFKYFHELPSYEAKTELKKKLYQKRLDFYNISNDKEANLLLGGMTYYKGMQLSEVSALSFDIETDGLVRHENSEIYIISNTFRRQGTVIQKSFYLDDYEWQGDMLQAWVDWVLEMDPSIMLGHNIFAYDLPYIAHVAKKCHVNLNLGRDGSQIKFDGYTSKFRKDQTQNIEFFDAHIYGRELVDTMFLSVKYDVVLKAFPSYGLKPIIKQLGLEKADRTFVDAGKIRQYYNVRNTEPEMWNKTKAYANDDSDDALKLFDKMAPSLFYFAQSVSMPFQRIVNKATGSQVNNVMVRSYLQDGYSIAQATEASHFEGAISFGVPGLYKNAFKVDVSSLYPSIMRQYEIYDSVKDPKGHFKVLIETFTLMRLKYKKLAKETGNKFYNDLQEAFKIFINSGYGFLGAPGLNYNSPLNAALVTEYGRKVLEKAVVFATGFNVEYWKAKAGIEVENETSV